MLIFWAVKLCKSAHVNVSEKNAASIFRSEYEGGMFLRNVGFYLVHRVLRPRKANIDFFAAVRTSHHKCKLPCAQAYRHGSV